MNFIYLLCLVTIVSSCHPPKTTIQSNLDKATGSDSKTISQLPTDENSLQKLADSFAHKYLMVDGHVDLPYRLSIKNFRPDKEFIGIPIRSSEGDFDYTRAKKGGLSAPFMSIYIPSSYQKGGAKKYAEELIQMVDTIIGAHPAHFGHGRSTNEVMVNFSKGLISLPMGMENGAPIESDLKNLDHFHNLGIRYITLTHAEDNQICDAAYAKTRTWNGLSPFGKEVIPAMNRIGLLIDISHVTDSTFWQVIRLTKTPVIASHSSCRSFTPGWERNMADDMIAALKPNGGIIMINFGSDFLDGSIQKKNDQARHELQKILEAKGLAATDSLATPLIKQFEKTHPTLYSDVRRVVDHIDHVVRLAGIDHVGFGSDFDGVGDSLPIGLKDVSAYPAILKELLKRGYSEKDIEKICGANLIRVWKQVEKFAADFKS
jgi:membrane dipeptidase